MYFCQHLKHSGKPKKHAEPRQKLYLFLKPVLTMLLKIKICQNTQRFKPLVVLARVLAARETQRRPSGL